ncbi:MAG: polysaccharide biosynthesis/export family protein [Paludibacteraceae bacterium]|nr:polysaccharide biosynthesis/export family protein [Paludibacteraceae bacterium]
MVRLFKALPILLLGVMLFSSCNPQKNVTYIQDTENMMKLRASYEQNIVLKPEDQVFIIVSCRDPQISAMFNLPYYTNRIGGVESFSSSNFTINSYSSANSVVGYTVDNEGNIDFPILGKIPVAGLRRQEVAELVKQKLIESNQIKDPVVTVEYMNLGVAVLGEVARPGRFRIDRDHFSIFDALSMAGDLNINGKRQNITVLRHTLDGDQVYKVDLTSGKEIYKSPAFYIQQGDVVYVAPTSKRARESSVNGNTIRSASFWVSIASLATSVTSVVVLVQSKNK